jgi:sarcosine oxidase gamma subunit
MFTLKRVSPVSLPDKVAKSEERNGYTVVLKYQHENEKDPWIIDLCHRPKYDFQCNGEDSGTPMGLALPAEPGNAVIEKGWLISAVGTSQFSLIHIGQEEYMLPVESGFSDLTDGRCLLAIGGKGASELMEKFTRMDFNDKKLSSPCMLQGPMIHTYGQLHILGKKDDKVFMVNLGRGYAGSVAHAILDVGEPYNLKPAGEDVFTRWLTKLI